VNASARSSSSNASLPLTLLELAAHLGRIERGERFPSAHVPQKIARPLSHEEDDLSALAGYLSQRSPPVARGERIPTADGRLDPLVARMLAQETIEVQRAVIVILAILNSIAKDSVKRETLSPDAPAPPRPFYSALPLKDIPLFVSNP
jgi:hypothetical protein